MQPCRDLSHSKFWLPSSCLNLQSATLLVLFFVNLQSINKENISIPWAQVFKLHYLQAGIFQSTFLQPVNGSKKSILNWVLKLSLLNLTLLVNFSSKLSIKLLISRKIAAVPDKRYTNYASAVRKSVGNALSRDLET